MQDNIKVASVANFSAGQKFIIGSGINGETAMITNVGTAGGTTVATAAALGATVIPVGSAAGFEVGNTITIGSGADHETAIIASVMAGRRGGGGGNRNNAPPESITVNTLLKYAHAVNAEVAGSGIALAKPLTKAHSAGTQIASSLPTPGEPNQYTRKR